MSTQAATNLLDQYWPAIQDLDSETVLAVRQRLEAWLLAQHTDLDTRPNSPFGDLYLTPANDIMTACLEFIDRFRSDLDLENTANGKTYDCDFVTALLRNLGVVERTALPASGVLRLVFCADQNFELDRGIRISFNNDAATVFEFHLPHAGNLEVLAVGSTIEADRNQHVLKQLTTDKYAVDVPLRGQMGVAVLHGVAASLDRTVAELDRALALGDFHDGVSTSSLAQQAQRARNTFYSASMTTRAHARRFLMQEFPALQSVGVTVNGDSEMVRASYNALGIGLGRLDVCVKSGQYMLADKQYCRITYDTTQDAFIGVVPFLNPPLTIDLVQYGDDTDLTLDDGSGALKWFSRSLDPIQCPLVTAAYSPLEELWVVIPMPRHPTTNQALIVPDIDANGDESSVFRFDYKTDPMIRVLHDYLQSRDVTPPGLHVLVRGFVPVVFNSLEIYYGKKSGTNPKLDQARLEIGTYMRGLGHPDLYSDSTIHDAMFYAGATRSRIESRAELRFSVADYVLKPDAVLPSTDLDDAIGDSVALPWFQILNSASFIPSWVDPNLGTADAHNAAVGPRNVAYVLSDDDIVFRQET